MSTHEFRLEVDQLVAEAKDLFGAGSPVHHHAELLYHVVVRAIEEADEDREEHEHPFAQDRREFNAENPVTRMSELGDYDDYRAVWACTQAQQASAMRDTGHGSNQSDC